MFIDSHTRPLHADEEEQPGETVRASEIERGRERERERERRERASKEEKGWQGGRGCAVWRSVKSFRC